MLNHYLQNSPSLVPIQSQRNAVHIFQNYFFKIYFNIILPLMAMTYKKSLPFRIAIQILNLYSTQNMTQSRR